MHQVIILVLDKYQIEKLLCIFVIIIITFTVLGPLGLCAHHRRQYPNGNTRAYTSHVFRGLFFRIVV